MRKQYNMIPFFTITYLFSFGKKKTKHDNVSNRIEPILQTNKNQKCRNSIKKKADFKTILTLQRQFSTQRKT